MVYIKSIVVGIGAAVLSMILLTIATIIINVHNQSAWDGVAFDSVSFSAVGILIAGAIVFAIGFIWKFRSSSRKPSPR
jgi:hypothetical protein